MNGLGTVAAACSYTLTANGVESRIGWWVGPDFTLSYAGGAAFLLACA